MTNQIHRALILTRVLVSEEPVSLIALGDLIGMHAGKACNGLMAEGLLYPLFDHPPRVALTSAPHVLDEVVRAADLLGLTLPPLKENPNP